MALVIACRRFVVKSEKLIKLVSLALIYVLIYHKIKLTSLIVTISGKYGLVLK